MVAEFGKDGIASTDIFRQLYLAAMGMKIRCNNPLAIMNFAHEKIARFMPVVSYADSQMFVRSHNSSNNSTKTPLRKYPSPPLMSGKQNSPKTALPST